jgi:alpha-glucosidase
VVPLWPVQQFVGERSFSEVELVCAVAAGEHESVWYDDDGERPDPSPGERCLHRFTLRADPCELTRASDGGWPLPKRWLLRFYGLDERVVSVERDEWVTFRHRA